MSYFKAKNYQIRFRLGFCRKPAGRAYSAPQTPQMGFRACFYWDGGREWCGGAKVKKRGREFVTVCPNRCERSMPVIWPLWRQLSVDLFSHILHLWGRFFVTVNYLNLRLRHSVVMVMFNCDIEVVWHEEKGSLKTFLLYRLRKCDNDKTIQRRLSLVIAWWRSLGTHFHVANPATILPQLNDETTRNEWISTTFNRFNTVGLLECDRRADWRTDRHCRLRHAVCEIRKYFWRVIGAALPMHGVKGPNFWPTLVRTPFGSARTTLTSL